MANTGAGVAPVLRLMNGNLAAILGIGVPLDVIYLRLNSLKNVAQVDWWAKCIRESRRIRRRKWHL